MRKNVDLGMKKLEEFLKLCKSRLVKVQVERVGLQVCLKVWKEYCQVEGMWCIIFLVYFGLESLQRCDGGVLLFVNQKFVQ